jgi:hypothetical protein
LDFVPAAAENGGMICVLLGCSVPVIIRKVKNHCIIIGERYVHGLMDGEAITKLNEGIFSDTQFILRWSGRKKGNFIQRPEQSFVILHQKPTS